MDLPRTRRDLLKRYGVAVGLPLLALVVSAVLPFPGGAGIYQLPLAAVVLSAWYGGRGPGWLASAIAVAGATYLLPPAGSFVVQPEHALSLSIFAALCPLLSEFGAVRRRDEQALRESEARFRKLTDLSADWYWKQDENLRFTVAMDEKVGFRPVSLGKTRWELPSTPLSASWDEHRAVLAARKPFRNFEYSRTDQAGATRYISVSGVPMFDEQGAFKGYDGVASDITSRKLAEAERQAHVWFLESMDRINRAMQGTNDVERMMSDVLDAVLERFACDRAWLLYPCDPDAPSWRAVMEHTRPEYPGAFAIGVALPADADTAAIFAAARASPGPIRLGAAYELRIPGHLAERFTIRSVMAMALCPKGDRPYLFGVHQCSHPRLWTNDEQRLFEEIGNRLTDALTSLVSFRGLRESERRLEAAQRVARIGWWERDYETGRVSLSDEACRTFGVQPVDRPHWEGRFRSLIHPEDQDKAAAAREVALAGGARYDVEYRVVRPDGVVRMVHSQGDVTRDGSGRAVRQFGVVQDITELRLTERRLEAAQRLAHVGWWERDFVRGRWLTSDEIARIYGIAEMDRDMDLAEWMKVVPSVIHPEDRRRVLEASEATLRGGPRYDIEYRIVHADGTVRVVQVQADVTLDEAGRPVRQFGVAQDITELRRAEQEVRARQDMLDLAQKAANAVAFNWYIGARESENRWSPELEAMYGLEPGTFGRTYKRFKELVHPDDWPSVKRAIERAFQSGDVDAEYRVVHKDGAERWLHAKGRMFFDAGRRPERIVGFMIDVTDRRQAEEELRATESRFRTFVDHATDAFFLLDEQMIVVDVNLQACAGLGYGRDELIGIHPRAFDVGLEERAIAQLAARVVAGETVTFETMHQRNDGAVFPVEIRARAFQQGEQKFVLCLVRDISERKRAEQELRSSEERFRTLVQFSFDVYWETDAQHRFTRQEFIEGLADAPEAGSEIGKTRWEVPYLEPEEEAWRKHRATLDAHLPFRDFEIARPASDGGRRYVSTSGLPMFDETGRFIGYRGVGRHITERKRAEQELQRLNLQLVHMSRVMTTAELATSIAHEVNQPLGSILASVGPCLRWLNAQPPDLASARIVLERVATDAERASQVISRIRALVRREPPRHERININEMISEVITLTRDQMHSHSISLQSELAADLIVVHGDRVQLQQVILNLIMNAIEAMGTINDRRRQLAILSTNDDSGVRVEVRDCGPGVVPDGVERIFEPFYTTKPDGIGMGLWICRSIIEAHGGRLWFTPNRPRGAAFQFALPRKKLKVESAAGQDRKRQNSSPPDRRVDQ